MSGKKKLYPRIDLTGKRFSRLIVIKFAEWKLTGKQGKRASCWLCQCNCGNQKIVRGNSLVTSNVQSCGCMLSDYRKRILPYKTAHRNQLPDGEAAFRLLLCNYKSRAKKKGLIFSISSDNFRLLISKPCYYCNRDPYYIISDRRRKKTINGQLVYTGLDRIDNSIGYTLLNVIPCCGICNKARRDLSQQAFILWIKDLTDYASKTDFYEHSLSS